MVYPPLWATLYKETRSYRPLPWLDLSGQASDLMASSASPVGAFLELDHSSNFGG